MLKVRFQQPTEDYRPVLWPIPHPYWRTGSGDDYYIIVAYVDSVEQLKAQWPEAEELDIFEEEADHYVFTARFSKPDWLDDIGMKVVEEGHVTRVYPNKG